MKLSLLTPQASAVMTLRLDDVTLVAIDSVAHDLTRLALEECVWRVNFGDVLVYSDEPIGRGELRDRWIKTSSLRSWAEVTKIWWHWLPYDIETSHYLMIQWDSWVIDPDAWDPLWLQWDYIGAPWPWHRTYRVGNGGFSLRSRRLAEHLAEHSERYPLVHPEDDALCRSYRPMLEAEGFRWAPDSVAQRFSFERGHPTSPTFGFHGAFNFPDVLGLSALHGRIAAATDYATSKIEWREMMQRYRDKCFLSCCVRATP
jgi:hypothetical protein